MPPLTPASRCPARPGRRCSAALIALFTFAGCSAPTESARRLVVLSPHRDEIRVETARGFVAWFSQRVEQRRQAALSAVQVLHDDNTPAARAAVTKTCGHLLADWNDGEATELRQALAGWQAQPGTETAAKLRHELTAWQVPEVQVIWQDIGGSSQISRFVQSSFAAKPKGIDVDLLFGGGTEIYLTLADAGHLQALELPEEIFDRIPPALNGVPLYDSEQPAPDRGRRWFGPVLSSFGILANRSVLQRIGEPVPRTWDDLGQPGLRGWVGAGDPRMTGSVHMVYEIILQSKGWDDGMRLLLRLGANTHTFIRDSGTLSRHVILGEVAAAGVVDVNALSAVSQDPEKMQYLLPPNATIINPDAIAVLKGAQQRGLAKAFVEFTLSDAGQRIFFLQPGQPGGPERYPLCRLSVRPDFYKEFPPEARSTGTTNPFEVHGTVAYKSELGKRRRSALNDLFGAWIVDAHPDLKAAWRAVLRLPPEQRGDLEEALFAPPCSEADLNLHARSGAGGPRLQTQTVTRWGEQARQRYRRIAEEARQR